MKFNDLKLKQVINPLKVIAQSKGYSLSKLSEFKECVAILKGCYEAGKHNQWTIFDIYIHIKPEQSN